MPADLDLATILKDLKDFYPLIEPRILMPHRRKMERIINNFDLAVSSYMQKEAGRAKALAIPNLPESIRGKTPEEITDEEGAQIGKIALIRRVLETNDIDAASKLVTIFNQTVKTESLRKWQQVKILDEFYMSKLLPALQKEFSSAGINLDVKIIVKKILGDLSEEMRGKVQEAVEISAMDDLVAKAKRRGKFVKGKGLFPDRRKMRKRNAKISRRKIEPDTKEETIGHDHLLQPSEESEDSGNPGAEESQE